MSLSTAQSSKAVEYYELVTILVGDNYRITNAPFDITYSGNTYKAFGLLLDFDAVEENSDMDIANLSINISGIAPNASGNSALTDFVGENYANGTVQIDRQYYTDHVLQGTVNVYKGYVTGADLIQSAKNVSSVSITTASHWHDFNRRNGHRTNSNSQKKRTNSSGTNYGAGDEGFAFSVEVQKEITWK